MSTVQKHLPISEVVRVNYLKFAIACVREDIRDCVVDEYLFPVHNQWSLAGT